MKLTATYMTVMLVILLKLVSLNHPLDNQQPTQSNSKIPTLYNVRVTAYCPCSKCCGEFADGITANGQQATGRFAAAPRIIPFGTKLLIPGYNNDGPVPVWDRGGAITGNRLDVFFDTHSKALQWGVQYLDVELIIY